MKVGAEGKNPKSSTEYKKIKNKNLPEKDC
jgi:hypothetical protein